MIEVKMYLLDALEVSMLAQLQETLELKRAAYGTAGPVRAQGSGVAPREYTEMERAAIAAERAALAAGQGSGFRQAVEAEFVPVAVPAQEPIAEEPVAVPVDDIAVQRAITEYAKKHGMPAARELLETFGAKKVGEVPAEKRAEFVEKARA